MTKWKRDVQLSGKERNVMVGVTDTRSRTRAAPVDGDMASYRSSWRISARTAQSCGRNWARRIEATRLLQAMTHPGDRVGNDICL